MSEVKYVSIYACKKSNQLVTFANFYVLFLTSNKKFKTESFAFFIFMKCLSEVEDDIYCENLYELLVSLAVQI